MLRYEGFEVEHTTTSPLGALPMKASETSLAHDNAILENCNAQSRKR